MNNLLETNPVLGPWLPDRGNLFRTSFKRFQSDTGIHGMAKVTGSTLELMVFIAEKQSTGQFRAFISQCKEHYGLIRIWAVLNDDLPPVLKRYGFTEGSDIDEYGDPEDVWDWTKKAIEG